MFQLLAVSIITGLLWWQRGRQGGISSGQDIMGLLFFELLFPSFRCARPWLAPLSSQNVARCEAKRSQKGFHLTLIVLVVGSHLVEPFWTAPKCRSPKGHL